MGSSPCYQTSMDLLTCGICGRTGIQRLGKHLTSTHGVTKEKYLLDHPGAVFEVISDRVPKCKTCGIDCPGFNPRAVNVLCDGCRKAVSLVKQGDPPPNRIPCLVCGVSRRMLTPHLMSAHGMTRDQYLAVHPGALTDASGARTRSDACKAKMAEKARQRWASDAERAVQSERMSKAADAWRGVPLTDERKAKQSKSGKGKRHILSPEGLESLRSNGRKNLEAVRSRPDAGAKLSAGVCRRFARGEIFGFKNPASRQKGYETRLRNGTLIPEGAGKGITGFRAGIPHYCRSTFEANFARLLIHLGIPYNYEPKLFRLSDGKAYTPDFYLAADLPDGLVPAGWVELKGWRKKDGTVNKQAKIDLFTKDTGHSITVLTMWDAVWKDIESRYRSCIPQWETHDRNLKTHPDTFGIRA